MDIAEWSSIGLFDLIDDSFFENELFETAVHNSGENENVSSTENTETSAVSTLLESKSDLHQNIDFSSQDKGNQMKQMTLNSHARGETRKQPTFVHVTEDEKTHFVQSMKNVNTSRKTELCMRHFQRWLSEPPRNETRSVCDIMTTELDNYIPPVHP
ncbi:hypothetical protein DPMN_161629 [Dreissena polymorpha]|uniref:Uncharacterized protein n=1 Tax=Dreissena polymorpha TaxID=45954 RepID=A0A9D4ESH6_DREPO|nr:hypothetical protein DPMN_161629 [Dreissena polymorpha]